MNEHLPTYQEWLNQSPLPEEIRYNDDGSEYIPIEFIKPKLDHLSPTWSTKNFTHFAVETRVYDKVGNHIGTTHVVSGSVELHLEINDKSADIMPCAEYPFFKEEEKRGIIKRVLCGSATFDVQKYFPNTNWGATCLSLCIVSASKELGDFFGKSLNKERLTVPTVMNKAVNKIKNTLKNLKTS